MIPSIHFLSNKEDFLKASCFPKEVSQQIISFLDGKSIKIKTSGSTGEPKSIGISHAQVVASIEQTRKFFQLDNTQKVLLCINPLYIGGLMMIFRAIHIGMKLVVVPPSADPLKGLDHRIDFAAMVPFQLHQIMNDSDTASIELLNDMRALILGGAPVTPGLQKTTQRLHVPVYSTYGMTETVSHVALKRLNQDNPPKHFTLLEGIAMDQDHDQCLKIKGAVTNDKWVQTNDIVSIIEPNQFQWVGRRDFIINSGGIKLIPEKIERKIAGIRLLKNAAYFVSGMPDASLGEKAVLFIEKESLSLDLKRQCTDEMKKVLDKYEVPKTIIPLAKFERTESSKINRLKTKQRYLKNLS